MVKVDGWMDAVLHAMCDGFKFDGAGKEVDACWATALV